MKKRSEEYFEGDIFFSTKHGAAPVLTEGRSTETILPDYHRKTLSSDDDEKPTLHIKAAANIILSVV